MHYRFVPLAIKDAVLEVGAVDPDNTEALDALHFISARIGMPFKVFLITETDFQKVLQMYQGLSGEVSKAITELDTTAIVVEKSSAEDSAGGKRPIEEQITEDAPVTKIVATILRYAAEGNASDIHIEHTGTQVRVRFRVDGLLYTSLLLPVKVHPAVVARIKILSGMKIDEKRIPQVPRLLRREGGDAHPRHLQRIYLARRRRSFRTRPSGHPQPFKAPLRTGASLRSNRLGKINDALRDAPRT